jgi:choline-sulfatase
VRRAALAAGAALVLLSAAGCRREPELRFPGAPIVLISVDTLRADRLPVYGYGLVETPAIDALAADAIVFENAYSHYPLTLPSHLTMLTGLYPPRHEVRDNLGYSFAAERHPFLPRTLAAAGYASGGFVSAFVLRAETGIERGFTIYDSEIEPYPGANHDPERPGAETAARALAWVREHRDRPFFLFLHLFEPHLPHTPLEPFRSRYPERPYDAEVATADAIVGDVLAELRRLGVYDRAIVAFVSDHGEGLGDHEERQHGVFLYRSTTHVPFLLKLPGQLRAGTRFARPVGLVDFAPTVLALVGLRSGDSLDGKELLPEPPEGRGLYAETYFPRLHFGWSDLKAIYEERWSYIDAPQPELYDLAADPGQLVNVLAEHRRDAARLRALVAAIDRPLADPEDVDPEAAAKLAALGYLSGTPQRRTGDLPDAKTQLPLLALLESGAHAFLDRRYDDAVVAFRGALEVNPAMLDIWTLLARSLQFLDRQQEALAAWERALDLSGGSVEIALNVAGVQLRLRRFAEARELAELARARDPRAADELLVQIELAEGRREEAFARMEEAARAGRATEGMARQLARQRLDRGRPREAVELLAPVAARAEPRTLEIYALALSETGRHDEALAALERALGGDASSAALHEATGIVLLRLARPADARAALERALAIDDRRTEAWNTLGVALYQLEGPRPALAAWRRALALAPERHEIWLNLGLVALQAGERAEARRALTRFVAGAPPERFAQELERARALLRELGG